MSKLSILTENPLPARYNYVIGKALAYAIVAIERLPEERQEWSDREDMLATLKSMKHLRAAVAFPHDGWESDEFKLGRRRHVDGLTSILRRAPGLTDKTTLTEAAAALGMTFDEMQTLAEKRVREREGGLQ